MAGLTTPLQAWAILSRHARDDIASLRLKELCTDNDRVSSLVAVHNGSETASKRINDSIHRTNSSSTRRINTNNARSFSLTRNRLLIADLSRQRMTLETLNHLLHLSTAVDVRGFIRTLAWGQNDRFNPVQAREEHIERDRDRDRDRERALGDDRRPHFSFDDEDIRSGMDRTNMAGNGAAVQLSPSRSVTSAMKKTRFAPNHPSENDNDDQTVLSTATNTLSPTNPLASSRAPLHTSPSMHMALRAPSNCNLKMLNSIGVNVLDEIHNDWNRIMLISDSIRKGQMRGMTGHLLQNILVVGRGTSFAACEFVYNALKFDLDGSDGLRHGITERKMASRHGRSMRFLSRADPVALHSALFDWNPDQTLVVSIVMNGDESDIMHLTQVVKKWLYQSSSHTEDKMWGKHILFVTGSEMLYHTQTLTKAECSFLIPQYVRSEGLTSLTVAGLLPLSIAFGWDIVQEMLDGAHDLDSHFVETNPRHNLPVLLALVDLWNDHFLPSVSKIKPCGGRIISPFIESFVSYPAFVATIEAQVCSRIPTGRTRNPHNRVAPSGIIIDGGLCGTFDRVSYQGGRSPPSELIISIDPQVPHNGIQKRGQRLDDFSRLLFAANIDDELSNQDHLMCSMFAHADVMAIGSANARVRDGRSVTSGYTFGGLGSSSFDTPSNFPSSPMSPMNVENDSADGNHPSTLILCSRCDAFTCGQLIALAEHRAMVTAKLWDIENPFAFAPGHGSTLRLKQEDLMREKLESAYQRLDLVGHLDDDDEGDNLGGGPKVSFAVKSLLGHYATSMHEKKQAFR